MSRCATHAHKCTHTHTRTHTYIHIYCVCVCVCECEFVCVCVCVCVCLHIYVCTGLLQIETVLQKLACDEIDLLKKQKTKICFRSWRATRLTC